MYEAFIRRGYTLTSNNTYATIQKVYCMMQYISVLEGKVTIKMLLTVHVQSAMLYDAVDKYKVK